MNDPLLTDDEHEFVRLAGQLCAFFKTKIVLDGPNREGDIREVEAAIHTLQARVMSNAAARAFPDRYRLLGGAVAKR